MDTVPTGARLLLDFIGDTEAPMGYGTIYANKQSKLPKPLTNMTLGEVIDAQKAWSKNNGSSAAGRYQFMRATLIDLSKTLGLSGNLIFNADLQDRLGYELLKRRGYADYMAGKIGRTEFGKRLAMEWASFPVLTVCKGAHRQLNRGQSFYAGDGLNKALVAPEKIEALLDRVKAAGNAASVPVDANRTAGVPVPPRMRAPTSDPVSGGKTKMVAGSAAIVAALLIALTAIESGWQHLITLIERIF